MTQTALVTGANKGIGLETARQLAQRGIHLLVGARDRNKSEAAVAELRSEGLSAEAIVIDVISEESIRRALDEVASRHQSLDILVNNAGVLLDDSTKPPSQQTLEVWRRTYEANVFGVVAVTRAFLPLLRQAPAARIVNVSSILGSLTLHSDPSSRVYGSSSVAYDSSKTALNAWTISLAIELRQTPIKVNAVHPGHVKTDMGGQAAPMQIVDGARSSVEMATLAADGPTGSYVHLGKSLPW
ncbi:MAG TPA: SDR family oxidoreductase [Steroidobacteraceae bacterium]|jgi:NAD(P)-dependent dehydrogenase (short-subunit alcohol dehydrogenase family)